MLSPIVAFTDYKLNAIDSYIDWDKNKLIESRAVIIARTCIESLLKALIICEFQNVVCFYDSKGSRLRMSSHLVELSRYTFGSLNYEIKNNPAYKTIYSRYKTLFIQHDDFHFPFNIGILKNPIQLKNSIIGMENAILYIKRAGDRYTHDHQPTLPSEARNVDKALNDVLDWFFKNDWFNLGINESDWKRIYLEPRKSAIFKELAQGIARESKILEKTEEIHSEEIIDRVKDKYFKYLEIECGKIQFDGLSGIYKSGTTKVILENSFVPIGLVEDIGGHIYDFTDRIKIKELLNSKNHLLILANAGSGKSTLIKSLAISCAFPERGATLFNDWNFDSLFPIYIRCRDLRENIALTITEIISYIPRWAEMQIDDSDIFFKLALDKIKADSALLLIDGIDEISEDRDRKQFIDQLLRFITIHPKIKCIITSRDAGVHAHDGSIHLKELFDVYKIAPLSNEEKEQLSERWHKIVSNDDKIAKAQSQKAIKEIKLDSHINNLAENPLILSALLLVRYRNEKLPKDRTSLYKETIKLLINVWNIEAHGHIHLDSEETQIQLSFVAYWMSKNNKKTITDDELRICIKEARKFIDRKLEFSISDFVHRVETRTGLLRMIGDGKYEFLHLNFQEFLAALALVRQYLPIEDSEKKVYDFLFENFHKNVMEEVNFNIIALSEPKETDIFINQLIEEAKTINDDKRKKIFRLLNNFKRDSDDAQSKTELIELLELNLTDEEFENLDIPEGKLDEDIRIALEEKVHKAFYSVIGGFKAAEFLGKCLARGIDFNKNYAMQIPGLFIKGFIRSVGDGIEMTETLREIMRNNKSRKLFDDHVRSFFSKEFQEGYIGKIIYVITTDNYNVDLAAIKYDLKLFLNELKEQIISSDKATSCIALIQLVFDYPMLMPELVAAINDESDRQTYDLTMEEFRTELKSVCLELQGRIPLDDPHYYCIWASNLFDFYNIYKLDIPDDYLNIYWNGWIERVLSEKHDDCRFYSALVLSRMFTPESDVDFIMQIPNIKELLTNVYENSKSSGADKLVAAYIGIILEIPWDVEDLRKLFSESMNTLPRRLFSAKVGIVIEEKSAV